MSRLLKLFVSAFIILVVFSCTEDTENNTNDEDIIIQKYVEIYQLNGMYFLDGIFKSVSTVGSGNQFPDSRDGLLINYSISLPNRNLIKKDSNVVLQHNIGLNFSGFEEALSTMVKGEKAQFFIPSKLAFGDKGIVMGGNSVAPNTVILLEVELKDIFPEASIIEYYLKLNNINAKKTTSGLYYNITSLGTTLKAPLINNNVTVVYRANYINKAGIFAADQTINYIVDDPVGTDLNTNVVDGLEEGVSLMKEGDIATLYIPVNLGYGGNGPTNILSNAILIYEAKLNTVVK